MPDPSARPGALCCCAWVLLMLTCTGCGSDDRAEPIRESYRQFLQALNEGDAAAAAEHFSGETAAQFGRLRTIALHGPAEQVARLPFAQMYIVAGLRHTADPEQIRRMDAAGIWGRFASGPLAYPALAENLAEFTVDRVNFESADSALAFVRSGGARFDDPWRFRKQDGSWRLDLFDALAAIDPPDAALARRGSSRQGMAEFFLEAGTLRPVDPSLWEDPDPPPLPGVSIQAMTLRFDPLEESVQMQRWVGLVASHFPDGPGTMAVHAEAAADGLISEARRLAAARVLATEGDSRVVVRSGQGATVSSSRVRTGQLGIAVQRSELRLQAQATALPGSGVELEVQFSRVEASGPISVLAQDLGLPAGRTTAAGGHPVIGPGEHLLVWLRPGHEDILAIISAEQMDIPEPAP